jgi:hypothetical protein
MILPAVHQKRKPARAQRRPRCTCCKHTADTRLLVSWLEEERSTIRTETDTDAFRLTVSCVAIPPSD